MNTGEPTAAEALRAIWFGLQERTTIPSMRSHEIAYLGCGQAPFTCLTDQTRQQATVAVAQVQAKLGAHMRRSKPQPWGSELTTQRQAEAESGGVLWLRVPDTKGLPHFEEHKPPFVELMQLITCKRAAARAHGQSHPTMRP